MVRQCEVQSFHIRHQVLSSMQLFLWMLPPPQKIPYIFPKCPHLYQGGGCHLLDEVNMLLSPIPHSAAPTCAFSQKSRAYKSKLRIKFSNNSWVSLPLLPLWVCGARSAETAAILVDQNHEDFSHGGMWQFLSTEVVYLFCSKFRILESLSGKESAWFWNLAACLVGKTFCLGLNPFNGAIQGLPLHCNTPVRKPSSGGWKSSIPEPHL